MSVTTTARDLISSSLRLIGATASGETPTNAELADAFTALNALIDGWATQSLTVPTVGRHVFALVSNQGTYTVGPTGDFVLPRPTDIINAGLVYLGATPTIEWPMEKIEDDEYAAIGIKDLSTVYPRQFYYNPTSPNGTLFLWPTPTAINNIALYTPDVFTQFADLSSSVILPPMYARALRYNLAVDLAPEFGKALDATVAGIATNSLAALKAANEKPSQLSVDGMYLSNRARWSRYNILSNQNP